MLWIFHGTLNILLLLGVSFVALRTLVVWAFLISNMNKALLVKILWDIHSKIDSLWVKSIHHDYLYRVDVWNWKPHTLYTPLIKKFLAIRDEIELRIGSIHTIISLLSKLYPSLDLIKPILFSALQFLCLFCRVSLG